MYKYTTDNEGDNFSFQMQFDLNNYTQIHNLIYDFKFINDDDDDEGYTNEDLKGKDIYIKYIKTNKRGHSKYYIYFNDNKEETIIINFYNTKINKDIIVYKENEISYILMLAKMNYCVN
jgi:hypothetical protein